MSESNSSQASTSDAVSHPGFENLLVERRGVVGLITINRPEVLNALNVATLREIYDAVELFGIDPEVRGMIITGSGKKAFVAGADIEHLSTLTPREAHDFSHLGGKTLRRIETVDKPIIAAVNGFALGGGCELALACDVIIASTRARFGQPEVNLGVIPGFGGTQRLARLLGKNIARYMVFTGEIFDAQWASRNHLAAEIVEPEELMDRCVKIIETIAKKAPLAIAEAKRVIRMGYNLQLDTAIELESMAFSGLFATEDLREGMGAFLAKRKADFKSK
ncbi:MAG: enoyl-CoA hydratase [Myxococcota bacterium]|jgi:enoyl-CoA hydratase